jgi:hypothetical protein
MVYKRSELGIIGDALLMHLKATVPEITRKADEWLWEVQGLQFPSEEIVDGSIQGLRGELKDYCIFTINGIVLPPHVLCCFIRYFMKLVIPPKKAEELFDHVLIIPTAVRSAYAPTYFCFPTIV